MRSRQWRSTGSVVISHDLILEQLRQNEQVRLYIEDIFSSYGRKIKLDANLARTLKTGVLLCYLMQEIEPRAVPRIFESPDETQAFRYKENIVFFLAACADIGVPKHRLFHVNDLWEERSIVRVVQCLVSLIEIVSSAENSRFKPLPDIPMPTQAEIDELSLQELMALRFQLAGMIRTERQVKRFQRVDSGLLDNKLKGLLEQELAAFETGICRFQAAFRGGKAKELYQKRLRDAAYRDRVAHEICSSEKAYVDSLALCLEIYYKPLQEAIDQGKPIISTENMKIIFSELQTIHALNQQLLSDIQGRVAKWYPNQKIGDIFLKIVAFLEVYTVYVQNYTQAVRILKKLQRKKKNVKSFLVDVKNDEASRHLDLGSFLIMPVQRIPRYTLLLKELVKHTWIQHPDYEALTASLVKSEEVANYINERKREAEHVTRTYFVQEILDAAGVQELTTMENHRHYIFEGETFDSKGKQSRLFLFNDLIIECVDKNDRAHTEADERRANLKKVRYKDHLLLDAGFHFFDIPDTPKSSNCIVVSLSSQKRNFEFACINQREKTEWLTHMQAVADALPVLLKHRAALDLLNTSDSLTGSPALKRRGRQRSSSQSGINVLDLGLAMEQPEVQAYQSGSQTSRPSLGGTRPTEAEVKDSRKSLRGVAKRMMGMVSKSRPVSGRSESVEISDAEPVIPNRRKKRHQRNKSAAGNLFDNSSAVGGSVDGRGLPRVLSPRKVEIEEEDEHDRRTQKPSRKSRAKANNHIRKKSSSAFSRSSSISNPEIDKLADTNNQTAERKRIAQSSKVIVGPRTFMGGQDLSGLQKLARNKPKSPRIREPALTPPTQKSEDHQEKEEEINTIAGTTEVQVSPLDIPRQRTDTGPIMKTKPSPRFQQKMVIADSAMKALDDALLDDNSSDEDDSSSDRKYISELESDVITTQVGDAPSTRPPEAPIGE